jgi:chloride channel 2
MVWYGMVWYGMVWYGMVWYGMVWYGMVKLKNSTAVDHLIRKAYHITIVLF